MRLIKSSLIKSSKILTRIEHHAYENEDEYNSFYELYKRAGFSQLSNAGEDNVIWFRNLKVNGWNRFYKENKDE